MTADFSPTPEQEAILEAARATRTSLMINAYAGCGKSSTLEMLANSLTPEPSLSLAFNVKIKKELEKRLPGHFSTLTLNGLGHRAWMRAINKGLTLDEKKLGKLVTAVAKGSGSFLTSEQWDNVRRLASAAQQIGIVPEPFRKEGLVPDTPEAWQALADDRWIQASPLELDLARAVLIESVRLAYQGNISFDDQIYCSTMLGGIFPRYPLVMVDEAQDLSPLNHIQLRRCAADRLIVVGDRKQAVYAFRGADSQSMDHLRTLRPEWIDLPLATTFRCPKVIVARQQHHATGYKAFPTAPEGAFHLFANGQAEGKPKGWTWSDVQALTSNPWGIAVLCRNNAPLLSFAFKLIRARIGVVMLGRDIGKGLSQLAKKLLPDESTPAPQCARAINDWLTREESLALANDNDAKAERVRDQAESLLAVLESGQDIATARDLQSALASLFAKESGQVTLSTGHRAKGLEWETVLHLDYFRVPSKQSQNNPAALEQELNLQYVIETRAKRTLILAKLEDFNG